ncbi:MAG: hypothetical protein M3T56_07825, partial [Chloroflexota bacterium]|nr:hypothetical protein [Chloroflexota bacterium]
SPPTLGGLVTMSEKFPPVLHLAQPRNGRFVYGAVWGCVALLLPQGFTRACKAATGREPAERG